MLKKYLKKFIWKARGGYKPVKFWDDFAEKFYHDSWQHGIYSSQRWLLSYLLKLKPQSVLEVGCGFGRNIKFFIENGIKPEIFTGCDISSKLLKKAKKFINHKEVSLIQADLQKLPFKDNAFDLVLTHGVLMHVSKNTLQQGLFELSRVSRKHILIVEQNYPADNEYTYIHDYRKLLKNVNIDIIEYNSDQDIGLDMIYGQIRKRS